MRRTNRRLCLCLVLLLLNLAFIWGNSALPADASGAFSEWVRSLLSAILPPAGEPTGGHLIRKLAHFSEFACLGLLFAWFHGMLGQKISRTAVRALVCGFLCACVDETIQVFCPGRGPSPVDVMIDTAGVATGIILLLLGYFICKKKKTTYISEEPI